MRHAIITAALVTLLAATAVKATPHIMTMPYRSNLRISPFSNLSQPTFEWIDGATVSIDVGYNSAYDRLYFDYEGQFPITATFNTDNGVLYLTGTATSSEYTDAIASVVFFTTAAAGARRQLSYSLGANTFYFPLTEHYYRYYSNPGITWTTASSLCAASSYFGMPGYLATITSQDEQNSVGYVATFDAWLGGNDVANFGTYTWVSGPEQGRVIWTGQSVYAGGVAPENGFTAWNRFQPENPQGTGQDYMYLVNSADQATTYWAVASDNSYVAGYICEYGAPNQTLTVQLAGGSIELVYSCSLFTTVDDCTAESTYGCQWSTSTNQCVQSTCSKYNAQTDCVSDSKCAWDTTSEIGVCTNTQCSSLQPAVCANNPLCIVGQGGLTCRPAYCSERTTPCACSKQDGCLWRNGNCASSTMVDCNGMDVVFVVDASAEMANPYGRYPQGFFGVMQALIDTDFFFNGNVSGTTYTSAFTGTRVGIATFGMPTVGVGASSNGHLTSNRAQWTSDIQGLQQSYSAVAMARNVRDALVAAQNMFDGAPNRTRVIVILAAGGIVDAQWIRNDYKNNGKLSLLGALQSLGVTIIGGAMESSSSDTINGLNAATSLALLTDGTATTVKTTTISLLIPELINGMCIGTSLSQYLVPGKVSIQCSEYADAVSCNLNSWCAWDPSAALCQNNLCLTFCTMSTCNNNEACSWDSSNAACLAKCPALAKDACLAEPTCSYDYPTAHCELAPCVSNPNEDACIADNYGCTWFASNSTPCQVTPCQTADATSCAQSYGCVFNGVDCVEDPCHTLVDPTSCAKLPQCGWNQDSALCQRNLCGMHATERQCAGDFNCVWNMTVSPAACGPRMCTSFNQDPSTAQAVCQLNSDQCIWQTSGQTPRCVVKTCELMLTSCDCATVDGCLWRNETCQRDSFAQCPPTDIVFLVEATPVMNDAFGRHPNGYVGIVEAIREWSQYAPFSWSPDAPGFRFALIEYGQGNPLYVPPSIGGGGALTNASSSWVGAGQELDWNEDNEKVYAGSGQSGYVQLRPALNQALTIFNTDTQNSLRKKLVVILGNSPITDGGSAMLKQITQLELLGVKIFANVIRRFSYVTDLDTTAENYMRPIASDPPSTFFSFTTIDTMTADLLDTFCDPSSKTGKFLQVSRNGELPCSWLTGSDECNAQGLCSWNSSAAKQCPQSGQCPTLGCATLPTALANLYTCDQCKLVSGAITCSRSNPPAVEKGLCQISTCAATCSNDCTNSPGCEWVPDTLTCERHVCSIYSTLDSCNSQAGCVWQDVVGQASCQKTPCSRLRDKQSCQTYASSTVAGYTFLACFMNNTVTPNVCMAYRCPMLQKGTCPGGDHSACQYDSSHDFCANKQCQYASAELCDLDATCYWDWYHGECFSRSVNCVLAPYSDWTPCSATCGNAYTYKTRAILQFPDGGSSCASVATIPCTESSCAPSDKNLTIIQTCTAPPTATKGVWIPANPSIPAGEWPSDCAVHCASYTIRIYCMRDSSCAWDGLKCVQTQFPGCKAHWTKADCLTSDMCDWDETYGVCQQSMQVCPYTTPTDCTAVSFCSWRTGVNAQVLSNSMGIPLQLVNPGQTPIFPFSTLASSDETVISGAVITIEGNYQRGKDTLVATFANKTTIQWIDAAGTLSISGLATVSEYFKTIRFITFTTTSTRTVPRTITWSLGNNTAFSSATMNHYKAITNVGASYGFAEADCARRSLYGLQGYLATITSQSENDLVSMKLFGDGWISGGDASGTTWQFTSGPTKLQYTFWNGPSVNLGGNSVGGHYSNWSPPNATNLYGEPIINTGASASGNDRVYLAQTGYWESRPFDTTNSNGYICEFGGMPSDVPPSFPLGGAMMVGIGGCVATNCIWHATQSMCTADIECAWNNGVCQLGCNALATQADCSSNSLCRWSTAILPPVCEVDPCASLAQSQCQTNTQCHWSATKQSCAVQTGCGLFVSQTACQASKSCYWSSGTCLDRGCATFTTVTDCRQIPKCRWDDNTQLCADQFCLYATQALCDSDSTRCDWNLPEDSRTMTFVPKTGTAYPFQANVDPCGDVSTTVNGITVAITAGMQANADVLSIDPTVQAANNYAVTYDGVVGIMKITVNSGTFVSCADAFNFMADAVQFSTTSASILTRTITYALQANTAFSVSTQTYYTAMSYTPTSFSDAQQYCAATGLFGLQGSLAVLSAEGDAQLVAQLGTTGWIAASSNAAGVWSWTTASGSMVPFWNGTGSLGVPLTVPGNASQLMFSIWDMGEPSLASSYGYVGIGGYWKAVLPGSSGGVICSYGSTTQSPTATISGFRKAAPGGCFVSMCKSLGVSQCVTNGQCRVQNGACEPDTRCQAGQTISECSNLALCYWDYSQQACLSQQPDACNQNTMVSCLNSTVACKWDPTMVYAGQSTSGFCVSRGCAVHPTSSPCKADPLCLWNAQTSTCYARLCGWTTEDQCWADPLCVYQNTQAFKGCTRSPCAGYSASACSQHDSCSYVKGECTYQRCSTTLGSSTCLQDKSCVFINNKCNMPACNWTLSQAACAMVPNCYFSVSTSQCLAAQCNSYTSLATCEQGVLKQSLKPCIWDNGACRQPTAADATEKNQCNQQVNGNMWWLWVFLAVILVLLGMILHRLYLAYAGSGNIFEPTRRNYKYNPHEKYAAAIVDHANERNEDSNVANVL